LYEDVGADSIFTNSDSHRICQYHRYGSMDSLWL